jgi:hypothetical protein
MNIVNRTLYDKNLIIRYNRHYLTRFLKKNFPIVGLITAGFITYMIIEKEWIYAIVLGGILCFYLGLTMLMQTLTTKRVLKQSPLVEHPVMQTYRFTESQIQIENIKSITITYDDLIKIVIAKEFFILHDRGNRTYIIDKKGFEHPIEDGKILTDYLKQISRKKH